MCVFVSMHVHVYACCATKMKPSFTDLIWSHSGTEDTLYCLICSESALVWRYCTIYYAMTHGSKSCRWTNRDRLLKAQKTSLFFVMQLFKKSGRRVLATNMEEIVIDVKKLTYLFVCLRRPVSLHGLYIWWLFW